MNPVTEHQAERQPRGRRESFIPLRRADLARLLAQQSGRHGRDFYDFCEILLAHLHHQYLAVLDTLKGAYAPFNPDRDTLSVGQDLEHERAAVDLARHFEEVLTSANYVRVSAQDLEHALNEIALIPLKTYVDFSDYQDYALYYRGDAPQRVERRSFGRTTEMEVDTFERVAVLLRFKDAAHFEAKAGKKNKRRPRKLNFTPGKTYLYLYKNVPKQDLELLFPNVKVWMTWKDRLLFTGPLLAGLGPMIIKILPSAGLLAGLAVLYVMGAETAHQFDFDEKKHLALWPILAAALSSSMLLGGFAVKQYLNYKNKRLQFLKRVTDTLFFKNLVSNRGVLMTIVDSAEEELGKEMMLAYYHLLKHGAQTKQQLDVRVEAWLREHCSRDVDFDVGKALGKLAGIAGARGVVSEQQGKWSALPLAESKRILDESWDNIYRYSSERAC